MREKTLSCAPAKIPNYTTDEGVWDTRHERDPREGVLRRESVN